MTTNADPLDELFIDTRELDRAALAAALRDYVAIDRGTGAIRLLPRANDLGSRRRVLAALLAVKVANLVGMLENPSITPKQLSEATGIPGGTVRPALVEPSKKRLISKDENGSYFVGGHNVDSAIMFLGGDA